MFQCAHCFPSDFVFTIRHGPSFSLGGSIRSGKGVVDISLRHLQDVGGARALVAAIIAVIDPITAATHPTCTVVTQVLPSAADYQKYHYRVTFGRRQNAFWYIF